MARRTLKDATAIVTGASMGIGRALALQLARQGARLVLGARSDPLLEELETAIRSNGGQAIAVHCDVTRADDRKTMLAVAIEHFGGVDILINNAGVGAYGPFAEASPERLRRIMEVNFFAAAELMRLCIPQLQQGRRPIIVNVASVVGRRALPGASEYCASKFALIGLSEALRAELRHRGIDLLIVCPGTTKTHFHENVIEGRDANPWPNHPKMSAEAVARKTVRAIRRGKHEIALSVGGKILVWGSRLMPRTWDRLLSRFA